MVEDTNYYLTAGWMKNHLDIRGYDLILYAIIFGFTQRGSGQKYSGSLSYLCDWTGLDKANVSKRLKALSEKGLLAKTTKIVNGVTFCEYTAIVPESARGCATTTGRCATTTGCCGSANNNNINNNIKEVSKDKSLETKKAREAEFEIFWKAYPKKKDKAKALKSFLKIQTPLTTLLAALEAQKRTEDWVKENGKYVPYPTTWLNGERWEDEIDPSSISHEPERPRRRQLKEKIINEYGEEENVYEYV